jgi:hypothetical protein
MGPGSYVITIDGPAKMVWEAELTEEGPGVCSPTFFFEGWPFHVFLGRKSDESGYWGVFLGCPLSSDCAPVPRGWKVQRVRADYTLSCPDHGWSNVTEKSLDDDDENLVDSDWGWAEAARLDEGVTKLKVHVEIKRLVADLEEDEDDGNA